MGENGEEGRERGEVTYREEREESIVQHPAQEYIVARVSKSILQCLCLEHR